MDQHIPVEHGQVVEHPHLIRCRMVTGAAETPIGSVIGYNVVPSFPAFYPIWIGSKIRGSD